MQHSVQIKTMKLIFCLIHQIDTAHPTPYKLIKIIQSSSLLVVPNEGYTPLHYTCIKLDINFHYLQ